MQGAPKGIAKKERTQKTTPSFSENPTNLQNQLKAWNPHLCTTSPTIRDEHRFEKKKLYLIHAQNWVYKAIYRSTTIVQKGKKEKRQLVGE